MAQKKQQKDNINRAPNFDDMGVGNDEDEEEETTNGTFELGE